MKSRFLTDKKTTVLTGAVAAIVTTLIIPVIFTMIANAGTKSEATGPQSAFIRSLKTSAPVSFVHVKKIYPHDAGSFTQGLLFYKGYLYESSGLYAKSSLARKDVQTGRTLAEVRLPDRYFGEGIALLKGKIYQLTWHEEIALVYGADTLKKIGEITYRGEGWGLTTDGRQLLMSDGSALITFRDPDTFASIRTIMVHDGSTPIGNLNELEYVSGEIWANIFMQDVIVRISPADGRVTGWIDLARLRLLIPRDNRADVLNGIAYDRKAGRIFVTGKFWPLLFEVQLTDKAPAGPQLP